MTRNPAAWLLVATVGLLGACQVELNGPDEATDQMEGLESPIVFGMVAFMSTEGVRTGKVEADTAYT